MATRFDIPNDETTEITPVDRRFFIERYGIDINECSATEMQILVDFAHDGASYAIMQLISRLQSKEIIRPVDTQEA